jgi:hypothetical protein
MKSVIAGLATSAVVGALTTVGVGLAAPASAGCETAPPEGEYCDAPVQPDGTWNRCYRQPRQTTYGGRGVFGQRPPVNACFGVDPSLPWPDEPLGPHYHID